jgi:hypothetical protein
LPFSVSSVSIDIYICCGFNINIYIVYGCLFSSLLHHSYVHHILARHPLALPHELSIPLLTKKCWYCFGFDWLGQNIQEFVSWFCHLTQEILDNLSTTI